METEVYGDIGDVVNAFTSSLRSAFLGNLNLNGTVPANVGRFTQIVALRFQNNQIEGTLPDSVGLLTSLTNFQIAGNKMNGTVPTDIGRLTRLSVLEMDQNSFVGPLPPQMSNLRGLTSLDISENELTGSLAPLSGISTLRECLLVIWLSNCCCFRCFRCHVADNVFFSFASCRDVAGVWEQL